MPVTVPPSLPIVLQVLRPCFTAPSFATLAALVTGALSGAGRRTVTGMWQAAGLAGSVHWSRAHRFLSRAVWDLDQVGLALARAVVARLVPDAGAVTVAVDDTLFHRYGKKVHGARYQHDGSAKGRDGIGRGNCFVIVGIVVAVPFLARQVCLPVLLAPVHPQDQRLQDRAGPRPGRPARRRAGRAHRPRGGRRPVPRAGLAPSARPRHLHHPPGRQRGAVRARAAARRQARTPRLEGPTTGQRRRDRGRCDLATHPGDPLRDDRDRGPRGDHLPVVGQPAPHPGPRGLGPRPGRDQALHPGPGHDRPDHPGGQIVARYASRWSVEQSIKDGKDLLGAGDAQNRLPAAVERTTPLGLANLTILVLWYDPAGRPTADLNSRRQAAPWYRHKRHVSVEDMIIAFRRARITGNTAAQDTPALFDAPASTSQATAA